MTFQNLQDGSKIFILHKDGLPRVEEATVCNLSNPLPKYPVSSQPLCGQLPNSEMVIHFSAKTGDKVLPYNNIPVGSEIVEYGPNIIITLTKDAMKNEVVNYMGKRQRVIDDYADAIRDVEALNSIYAQLDPEVAKRKQLEEDNANLRNELSRLSGEFAGLKDMLAKALSDKEKSNSTKK